MSLHFGEYGMEILLDEVASGEYMEEGESFTFDYFDKQYEKLIEKCNKKENFFNIYEFVGHLKFVIDSFSDEDKKKAGKERNLKFEKIETLWSEMGKEFNKAIDSVMPDLTDKMADAD